MKRRIISAIIFCMLMCFLSGNSYAQSSIAHKKDTMVCFINSDTIVDYIIRQSIGDRPYTTILLDICISADGAKYKTYSKRIDLEEGVSAVSYDPDGDLLIESVSIDPKMNYSYETIYKYFPQLDDWFLYGSYEDNQLFSEVVNGKSVRLGDSIWVKTPNISDSIIQIFNNDYSKYLSEYKSKKFVYTKDHSIYKTLDYLNYVEINKNTVQKYNDIAFFLLEAGNCQDAIYLLDDVIFKFPNRTVAYLNLGDAYNCNGDYEEAKQAYQKYIELMKASGKECKIPKRVFDRIKE